MRPLQSWTYLSENTPASVPETVFVDFECLIVENPMVPDLHFREAWPFQGKRKVR
jgi:hypothetical protein